MRIPANRLVLGLALCALTVLVVAAPAGATAISGHQVPVTGAKFKMKGDLLGKFKVTKLRVYGTGPVFRAKGKEKFNGCIPPGPGGARLLLS